MHNRDAYMKTLLEFKDKKVIKIVTGMRRCGKSTLLQLFAQRLLADEVPEKNIIEMNFESIKYDTIKTYLDLYSEVKSKIIPKEKMYIILDEVQMIKSWEKAVNSMFVDFDTDIYITGSNAYLLSSELATLLSGRYVEIKMLPLSFQEFMDFHAFQESVSNEKMFEKYLMYGGMPAIAEYDFNQQRISEMLEGIYSTVVLKDVVARNMISDPALLQKIVLFLADNIGNITSPNRIGNTLKHDGAIDTEKGRNPASRTVDNYIRALQNAFIFYEINRFDVKGKQYLKTLGKFYIVDTGIRNMLLGYRDADRGHILENVVYFELLRRGYRVSIGRVGEREIDFIAEKPDDKKYYQVTESLLGENVREREFAPLRDIRDNFEKTVLSMDKSFINSYEGIKQQNIIEFLMAEQ
jgi:predicted AAA+ superfamily ATPase